jgi:hypothetical protein
MILVNQPYIFTVDEAGQLGSKIELFIWNGDTPPATPNYTFTKQIASATDTANYYNISPFLAEFIQFGINTTDTFAPLGTEYYAKFRVKNYYLDIDGIYQPLFIGTPPTNLAMYGQVQGELFFGGLLPQTTYETYGLCSSDCETIRINYTLVDGEPQTVLADFVDGEYRVNDFLFDTPLIILPSETGWNVFYAFNIQASLTVDGCPFGTFTLEPESMFDSFSISQIVSNNHLITLLANNTNKIISYTDLITNETSADVLTPVDSSTGSLFVINAARYPNGTKVQLLSNTGVVRKTYIFKQKCECLYEPVKVQYLNSYGAFFTVWFYKSNKQEFSIENSEFKRFQNVVGDYYEGKQRQTFNTSGREKITVNSDWVNEDFSEVIKDIMLSEYTLVNDKFANIESKSIEIQQNINNGLINYQLTFTYSNDYRR